MNSLIHKLRSRLKCGLNSIYQISSPQRLQREESDAALTEQFRVSMLELTGAVEGEYALRLGRRIRYASNLQALWFMRSEMMALLAPVYGEAEAMHKLEVISADVRESLPSGLRSRPSPLNNSH
jgi:hypothetical protein